MSTRFTAKEAQVLATKVVKRERSVKSSIWEKGKKKALIAAINGQHECLFVGINNDFLDTVHELGFEATPIYRDLVIEEKRAEIEENFVTISSIRDPYFEELERILKTNRHFVTAWEELRFFIPNSLNEFEDEYEDDTHNVSLKTFYSSDFTSNLASYPKSVANCINKIIALEDEYSSVFIKWEFLNGLNVNDFDDVEDREIYLYECPLPKGVNAGVLLSWSNDPPNKLKIKISKKISQPLLSWISSMAGQGSIKNVEDKIKIEAAKRKFSCLINILVDCPLMDSFPNNYFHSFEIFQLIFKTLGFLVTCETNKVDLTKTQLN